MTRYAIYFTPPKDDPLTIAAASWLGRDAFSGDLTERPLAIGADAVIKEPARYGFHATLVAPFRLALGNDEHDLISFFSSFCAQTVGFEIDGLRVSRLGSFLALTPIEAEPALSALAADAVKAFAPFRAPLNAAEIERRNPSRLTARQVAYLERYGYPYVMDEFRFHMSLTGSVSGEDANTLLPQLERHFGQFTARALMIDSLALFVQRAPDEPFSVLALNYLSPQFSRKTA